MSKLELMHELTLLPPEDLREIQLFTNEMLERTEHAPEMTPELEAAIAEAEESLQKEGGIPIEEIIEWLNAWEPTK